MGKGKIDGDQKPPFEELCDKCGGDSDSWYLFYDTKNVRLCRKCFDKRCQRGQDQQIETPRWPGDATFFQQVLENRIEKIRSVLSAKAEEYASNNDRFHNFRVGARKRGTTPEDALAGMMLKHEISVADLVERSLRLIDEKIGDNINYLVLLEGLLRERIALSQRVLTKQVKLCMKIFKDSACGYSGKETWCNKTYERCAQLGNQERFYNCAMPIGMVCETLEAHK